MIKKISIEQLKPGMFIQDLNCGWLDHPFLKKKFHVRDDATIDKIRKLGIKELYIDTIKGADVFMARSQQEVNADLDRQIMEIASKQEEQPVVAELREESVRAKRLHSEGNRMVRNLMGDIRVGQKLDMEKVDALVGGMVESVFRNQDALLPLARLKHQDSYTFEHSVGVCTLMTTFAKSMKLSREIIQELSLGALLHDVGKALVPDEILNKPAKLSDDEFDRMKAHVAEGIRIVDAVADLPAATRQVVAEHHERFDGRGYPQGLPGGSISLYGQMAAIVDVYDAISSERVYQRGLEPTHALRKLLEWSDHHFDPALVQAFIRTLGVYPTGSLVRLESNRLGVVVEQREKHLLEPVVRVFFHAGKQYYIPPELVDLAKSQDRITGFESYDKWNIDPYQWLPS